MAADRPGHRAEDARPFDRFIDDCLEDALSRGSASFADVVSALPSVYPSLVLNALGHLSRKRKVSSDLAIALRREAAGEGMMTTCADRTSFNGMPSPHPLDYEWRFTDATIRLLLAEALGRSVSGNTIALLGVPSVFHAAHQEGIASDRRFLLFDFNRRTLEFLNEVHKPLTPSTAQCDLLGGKIMPATKAIVTLVDAPWYPRHLHAFLRVASAITVAGGYVIASVPPVGTRPGIPEEWEGLLANAEEAHLRLVEQHPLALAYNSPFFEWNALRASGIANYPRTWRRGNMAIFRRESNQEIPLPAAHPMPVSWSEIDVGGVRVRFQEDGSSAANSIPFADPSLIPIVSGNVLPTVSRRDRRRTHANVWTSGNRVYRCAGTSILREILVACNTSENPVERAERLLDRSLTAREAQLIHTARCQVRELIAKEQREMIDYGY